MKFRQTLFWDTDLKNIDVKKNARYIIERILEYGEPNEVRWLFKTYPKSKIKKVILQKRSCLSRKSAAFWADFLGLPKSKILCLRPSYQKMRKSHWPY